MRQLVNLYGLAAACFALVALRDYCILREVGGGLVIGFVVVLNTLSSAATDYVMHNHSWMSRSRARLSLIAAGVFLFIGGFFPVANYFAYVLGSLTAAYIGGQRVTAGRLNFPSMMYFFELLLQISVILISGGVFSLWQFVLLRVGYSGLIYVSFVPKADVVDGEFRVVQGGLVGQVSSISTSLSLAYVANVFYSSSPALVLVQIARVLAYFIAAFGISFNYTANKVATSKPHYPYTRIGGALAAITVGVALSLLLLERSEIIRLSALVVVSVVGAGSVLMLRIASRVENAKVRNKCD
jgi:hypothetical protein